MENCQGPRETWKFLADNHFKYVILNKATHANWEKRFDPQITPEGVRIEKLYDEGQFKIYQIKES
jgi:hypothetical protein